MRLPVAQDSQGTDEQPHDAKSYKFGCCPRFLRIEPLRISMRWGLRTGPVEDAETVHRDW